ncbi:flavodoxin family protein [Clostridium aminobutyricum]|uniref:Flavodoxin family protein n=1 Tax=Clostridium aminobutyricum TaxID=33953 RepID=A0A939D9C1_CLOAM|nr:flavodoxin family protein [Clostridium aminobutyricum]MBN7773596.1 flavodoxin family protein [Clostridium aminobutyricum]
MKVIAINGSPRENGNTAVLLQNALRGAESNGAETELVNLYDLNFKGCISCFVCKRKGNTCDGICAMKDDLTKVLENILTCDVLLLGSPIYFGNITGELRSFLERLCYPNLSYNEGSRSVFHGKIASGFIYSMNVPEEQMKLLNYGAVFEQNKNLLQLFNGNSEILCANDTYQFKEYSLYEASRFDEAHKAKVKAEQFPSDCQRAFEMGARLTSCS